MASLHQIISYWKERQKPHPPIPKLSWDEALRDTVLYLTELNRIKRGGK